MTEKLISFHKNELSYNAIIGKDKTLKHKLFIYLMFAHIAILTCSCILAALGKFLYLSIPVSIIFILDFIRSIKYEKGILRLILKKMDAFDMAALQPYKEMYGIDFETKSDGLNKVREKKIESLFNKHQMVMDWEYLLSSLKHKERMKLNERNIVYGAIMVAIISALLNLFDFAFPLDYLREYWIQIKGIDGGTMEKQQLHNKVLSLVIVYSTVAVFIPVFCYPLFTRIYLDMTLKKIKELQEISERIFLSKRKK